MVATTPIQTTTTRSGLSVGVGGGLGAAAAQIVMELVEMGGHHFTDNFHSAVATILTIGGSWVAIHYFGESPTP